MVIQGHHGGLKSRQQFKGWLAEKCGDPQVSVQESLDLVKDAIPDLKPSAQVTLHLS